MAGHSKRNSKAIGDGITTKRYELCEGENGFKLLDKALNAEYNFVARTPSSHVWVLG
jgi:hypothetical protein